MLQTDKLAAIRHAVVVEKRSRRSVAKAFKVGRKTIDRYVDGDAEPGLRKKVPRPSPRTDAARGKLKEFIATAQTKERKKHRWTAHRAYEPLRTADVDVGYTVVKGQTAESASCREGGERAADVSVGRGRRGRLLRGGGRRRCYRRAESVPF
jgi:transposase